MHLGGFPGRLVIMLAAACALGASTTACGGTVIFEEDDGGNGGAGQGGSALDVASAGTGDVASSGSSSPTTGTGGGTAGVTTVATSGPTSESTTGGCEVTGTSACADVCQCDAGCMVAPPEPGGACNRCVLAERAQGSRSECAVAGFLGEECSSNPACSTYVECVLQGTPYETCAIEHPRGEEAARIALLHACGDCGS